jgi:hypothetical protein
MKTPSEFLPRKIPAISDRTFFLTVVAFLVLWRLPLCFTGVGLFDEGFSMTFYQFFFSAPANVEFNYLYYLTGPIGWLWDHLFPDLGFAGFNLLWLLVSTLSVLLAYGVFRDVFNAKAVSFGLLCYGTFDFLCGFFHYNTLTLLLSVLSLLFLYKGVFRQSKPMLFFAGFFLALNVFARIPNAAFLALGLLVPFFSFFNPNGNVSEKPLKNAMVNSLACGAGMILGFTLVFLTMLAFGHLEYFLNAVKTMSEVAQSPDATHSFGAMLDWNLRIVKGGIQTCSQYLFFASAVLGIIAFACHLVPTVRNEKIGSNLTFSFYFLLILAFFIESYYITRWVHDWMNVPQVIYFITIATFLFRGFQLFSQRAQGFSLVQQKEIFLILAVSCIMFAWPVGCDFSIFNAGRYTSLFMFPVAFGILERFLYNDYVLLQPVGGKHGSILPAKALRITALVLIGAFVVVTTRRAYFEYFTAPRASANSIIDSKQMRFVLADAKLAANINGLINALKKEGVREGDELFCIDHAPTLHYITKTRPWVGIPTPPMLSNSVLKNKIAKREKDGTLLPCFVQFVEEGRIKGSVKYPRLRSIKKEFLARNNYTKVYSGDYFELWRPSPRAKANPPVP